MPTWSLLCLRCVMSRCWSWRPSSGRSLWWHSLWHVLRAPTFTDFPNHSIHCHPEAHLCFVVKLVVQPCTYVGTQIPLTKLNNSYARQRRKARVRIPKINPSQPCAHDSRS
eukprot:COSAG02_NODE_3989_length_5943_cov_5.761636_5_plen_111_part_00